MSAVIDWAVSAARLLQFASTLILFGSALFCFYERRVEVIGVADQPWAWPRPIFVLACAVGIVATFGGLMAQAASLTGTWTSWGSVLAQTRFGRIAALRAGLLGSVLAAALVRLPQRRLRSVTTVFGGAAVASFAWTGHGTMDDGAAGLLHLGSDVLHLLAAGVWIGALLPLGVLIVRSLRTRTRADAQAIAHALTCFSGIGLAVVAILILTGLVNSWFLIGVAHWRELPATAYGRVLVTKIALFVLMLALAGANRYRLTPALNAAIARAAPALHALRRLRASVIAETILALLVLAAVALLGTLEPPISG